MKIKTILIIIALCSGALLRAQQPFIQGYTVIPAQPLVNQQVKIATQLSTPNSSFLVDKTHSVNSTSGLIRLHLCYASGISPVVTSHIDTFAIGQLPSGVYSVQLDAYMSSAGQFCARVDSNFTSFTFTVSGDVGLEKTGREDQLRLYPVPSGDYMRIESQPGKFPAHIQLLNTTGATVLDVLVQDDDQVIDLRQLPCGIYTALLSDRRQKVYYMRIAVVR